MDSNDIMELLKNAQAKNNVPSNPKSNTPSDTLSDEENQYQSILDVLKNVQSNGKAPAPAEEEQSQSPDGILEMLKNAQSRDDSSAPREKKKPSESVLKILNMSHSTESKTTPEEANSTSISASSSLPFEQVISYIPVNDDLLYVSKIYNLFNKLRENPGNDKVAAEVSREIETRCNEILQLIDRYRYDDCPPDMKDLSDEIADAVEKYFDGMCYFKEYIADRDEELVLNALELVFLGDQLVNEIQFKINRHIAENPVTTWL